MITRIAYMPLATYPEAAPEAAVGATLRWAATMGLRLDTTIFEAEIPQPVTPFGSIVLDIPDLVRRAEERSRSDADRLAQQVLAEGADVACARRRVVLGGAEDIAVAEARLRDLSVLPVVPGRVHEMAVALVFGAGRPVLLVPVAAEARVVRKLAVAWDGSCVAARALRDGLDMLEPGGTVSVLTVTGEKSLAATAAAEDVVRMLDRKGIKGEAVIVQAQGRSVAEALQDSARHADADLLALGGFGHSRLRDFVLGGVTKDVLAQAAMPVLLSH